ncbi:MAG: FAD:protein FMN transferase [Treponema sp.]|nr:FAD:protein FMN transferase [Treponema sp.]
MFYKFFTLKRGFFFICFLFFTVTNGQTIRAQESEFTLGTVCVVNLYERGTNELYRKIFRRIREIEEIMSANRAGTDLDRVNKQAGIMPVHVREELLYVVERALVYAQSSGGAFDPTIGPLVNLWGIGGDAAHIPGEKAIQDALSLVNWRDLIVDRQAGTLFLKRPGMALDLGAIAKGYAADEAARIIKEARIPGAIVDLGGNVFAYGEKEGSKPWRIGIQDPLENRGTFVGILEVRNKTVVTSGVYERFLQVGGKRYHHILSPQTGYPADTGLLSVTIIADRSIDADALATAAFALGYHAGRILVESVGGAAAIFLFENKTIRGTAPAMANFSLYNQGYRILP